MKSTVLEDFVDPALWPPAPTLWGYQAYPMGVYCIIAVSIGVAIVRVSDKKNICEYTIGGYIWIKKICVSCYTIYITNIITSCYSTYITNICLI